MYDLIDPATRQMAAGRRTRRFAMVPPPRAWFAVAVTTVAPALFAQGPTFAIPYVSYFTGDCPARSGQGYPISLVVRDFNGDAKPDLAVCNYGCGSVALLRGNGNGTFQAPTETLVQRDGAQGIAAGDFNRDGIADLAVGNSVGHSVSILLGNGDGTFGAAVNYPTPFTPVDLAASDLNGDGFVDLAVVTNGANTVSVLLGNGDGTLQAAAAYATGDYPFSVAIGDFNGDLRADLVVANFNDDTTLGSVSILTGNGNGTFQAAVAFATGLNTKSVATGDFNGDGRLDVVAANYLSEDVSVLFGNGDGTLQAAAQHAVGGRPHWLAVADLDGDTRLDLAVSKADRTVAILRGLAGGGFAPPVNLSQAGAFADPQAIVAADLNLDGRPDLATANLVGDNATILLNTSDGVPTAVAGPDQSLHSSSIVQLDGSASFDDNTPSSNLGYTWSFVARPSGSIAVLTTPTAATTQFVADLPGTYRVQLVVVDSLGQVSNPSEVVVASTNLAPTADAGADRGAVVGDSVVLSGAESADPELDGLTYQWSFAAKPPGSVASLVAAFTVSPAFIPDVAGAYELALVVNDGFGPSVPDTVMVTAITGRQQAQAILVGALATVNGLPRSAVTTRGNQRALARLLTQAIQRLQNNHVAAARVRILAALERTDGCALRGSPDHRGPGRDWVVNCASQSTLYTQLRSALDALTP